MIIWSGFGFLAPLMWFGILILTQFGIDAAMGPDTYTGNGWPKLVAGVVAGIAIWFAGAGLNGGPGKVFIDKETGKEVVHKKNHTFFFIPFQYWAFISVAIGILMMF